MVKLTIFMNKNKCLKKSLYVHRLHKNYVFVSCTVESLFNFKDTSLKAMLMILSNHKKFTVVQQLRQDVFYDIVHLNYSNRCFLI